MYSIFASAIRAISSAGSEHLPYKQGVTGSNPVSPTKLIENRIRVISSAGSEHLPYKQGVTGSNPVLPTKKASFKEAFFILQ